MRDPLGSVTITAPKFPVTNTRTARNLGYPKIKHSRFAQTRQIANNVDQQSYWQSQEILGNQKYLCCHSRVDDEKAIGYAAKHLRARKGAMD